MNVNQTRAVVETGAPLPFIVLERGNPVKRLLKFGATRLEVAHWILRHVAQARIAIVGPVFNQIVPICEVVLIVGEPSRNAVRWNGKRGESPRGVQNTCRPCPVDHRRNAVYPISVIDLGIAVVTAGLFLQAQGSRVRVIAVARILACAISPQEPFSWLGQLNFVLVELNIPQGEPVIALVHRGAEAAVESVY